MRVRGIIYRRPSVTLRRQIEYATFGMYIIDNVYVFVEVHLNHAPKMSKVPSELLQIFRELSGTKFIMIS